MFEIKPTKNYGLTDKELFKVTGSIPVVSNSLANNGIKGYISKQATEKGNMVTFSDTTTDEAIFYQPIPFIGYSHIQGMQPKIYEEKWNFRTYSYLISAMRYAIKGKYNYGSKFNRERANKTTVLLPIKGTQPDFEFMENFIAELKAYLLATGLSDYILSDEERAVLELFRKNKTRQWLKFSTGDLFDILT